MQQTPKEEPPCTVGIQAGAQAENVNGASAQASVGLLSNINHALWFFSWGALDKSNKKEAGVSYGKFIGGGLSYVLSNGKSVADLTGGTSDTLSVNVGLGVAVGFSFTKSTNGTWSVTLPGLPGFGFGAGASFYRTDCKAAGR